MKKINIGFVLTIITLLVVIIYNVNLTSKRKVDKVQIEQICKNYIEFANKYTMVEKKYRTLPRTISDKEYSIYLANMKNELKKFFIDNNEYLENQYASMKENLDEQIIDSTYVITNMTKDFKQINEYLFIDNKVEVKITTYVNANYITKTKDLSTTNEKIYSQEVSDTITLQKLEGEWKVSYANLEYVTLPSTYSIFDLR